MIRLPEQSVPWQVELVPSAQVQKWLGVTVIVVRVGASFWAACMIAASLEAVTLFWAPYCTPARAAWLTIIDSFAYRPISMMPIRSEIATGRMMASSMMAWPDSDLIPNRRPKAKFRKRDFNLVLFVIVSLPSPFGYSERIAL